MRVVHVIARLNDGGPARVIAALAASLTGLGFQQHVLTGACPPGERDVSDLVRAAGVAVEPVPGLGRTPGLGDVRALAALDRRLVELRPDVVHTHTAKAGALGRVVCRWNGLRCLHTYHGHVLHGYFPWYIDRTLAWAERALAGSHHHHALTPGLLDELARRHGIGRMDRWHHLPIPVTPPARLPRTPRARPVVGFLGRLAPVKDIGLWLDTFAELRRHRDVTGLVCGDGLERAAAEAKATGLPIRFAGTVPAAEALAGMDVLLMTSRNEGLPLVAVEAMAVDVPVVAPPVGGLADLAAAGMVRPAPRTAAGLAAAVAAALDVPPPSGAAVYAASLTPAALAPRWATLYAEVAG